MLFVQVGWVWHHSCQGSATVRVNQMCPSETSLFIETSVLSTLMWAMTPRGRVTERLLLGHHRRQMLQAEFPVSNEGNCSWTQLHESIPGILPCAVLVLQVCMAFGSALDKPLYPKFTLSPPFIFRSLGALSGSWWHPRRSRSPYCKAGWCLSLCSASSCPPSSCASTSAACMGAAASGSPW